MGNLNNKLLEFFTEHYKPGIIGLAGTKDTIGLPIREAQRAITADERHLFGLTASYLAN